VRNKVKLQAKNLLPAEVIHSVKSADKKLCEKTTTINSETERIRIMKNTLDSKSLIVSKQLTESRATKEILVEKNNIKKIPRNSSPRSAIGSISKNDERPSIIISEEQPAGYSNDFSYANGLILYYILKTTHSYVCLHMFFGFF